MCVQEIIPGRPQTTEDLERHVRTLAKSPTGTVLFLFTCPCGCITSLRLPSLPSTPGGDVRVDVASPLGSGDGNPVINHTDPRSDRSHLPTPRTLSPVETFVPTPGSGSPPPTGLPGGFSHPRYLSRTPREWSAGLPTPVHYPDPNVPSFRVCPGSRTSSMPDRHRCPVTGLTSGSSL